MLIKNLVGGKEKDIEESQKKADEAVQQSCEDTKKIADLEIEHDVVVRPLLIVRFASA